MDAFDPRRPGSVERERLAGFCYRGGVYCGQVDGGGGVRGDGDLQGDLVAGAFPTGGYGAVGGAEGGFGPCQAALYDGADDDALVAGRAGTDAADRVVEVLADRAEGVVVEGVHAHVAEAAVWSPGVPALPHGGGTQSHLVEPGGVGLGEQELVGDVVATGGVQTRQQAGGADEAGGQMVVEAVDLLDVLFGGQFDGGGIVRQQAHREGEGVAGLAATRQ